ncbi:MAG: dipeptidase [Pseudomonadota bacterium]
MSMSPTFPKVFDGHNDFLNFKLNAPIADCVTAFSEGSPGHIDLVKAAEGGLGGGFFAVYVSSPDEHVDLDGLTDIMANPPYALPNPDPVPIEVATPLIMKQIALLNALEAAGAVKVCTTVADLEGCLQDGPMAAILHFEGAEGIDPDFHALHVYQRAGLRSLGPVWSRDTRFAHGVPFTYPSTPDIGGGGLTEEGRALVRECNRLGIMIDLSHITEAGFWDVAAISDAPLVATHSNAHAVCPHSRNLTDKQLDAIAESDGMVGLNFATAFLRPDGKMVKECETEILIRHLDHLISRLGEDRVGIGSDFDGAVIPEQILNCRGLPVLQQAMADHQYGAALIEKISHGNWMRALGKVWR